MIDIAPQLQAARAAIEERRWADAATHLIAAWNPCRIERIARAVAAVDRRLPPPRPFEETRANRREHEFHELVKTGDAEDLRRALAAPWPTSLGHAEDRVNTLSRFVSPRISNALLALHRSAKYSTAGGAKLSRSIFHMLIAQDDHAVTGELERLEQLPHERERLGHAVFRRRRPDPPYLSPAGEGALAAIEQLLTEARTTGETLLAAIHEAPYDDAPRMVYADALTEAGDLRGELITLQLQRGFGGKPTARERKLLAEAGRSWLDGLDDDGATKIIHERGFPAIATLAAGEIRVPAWALIEKLYLVNGHVFRGAPHLRALRALYELGAPELRTATLWSYDLDFLSVRDHAEGIDGETRFAPKTLGLSYPVVVPGMVATVQRLRTMPIARRLETVRLPFSLRHLPIIVNLVNETGYAIELSGSLNVAQEHQWTGRVTRSSLYLRWARSDGGDVAYATIVPVLSELTPQFEEVEIVGEAPDTPKVREALMRLVEGWPRLRSAKILGLETPLTN